MATHATQIDGFWRTVTEEERIDRLLTEIADLEVQLPANNHAHMHASTSYSWLFNGRLPGQASCTHTCALKSTHILARIYVRAHLHMHLDRG